MALAEPFSGAPATLADTGDPELLQRAIDGDRGAFEALYTRYVDAAFRTACATAGNRHDAADATAEAFSKLFQRISDGRLTPDVPFRGYLLATVRNAALDQHRANRRRTPTDDEQVFDIDRLAPGTPDDADPVVRGEEAVMITRAFGELPERWRSVLWLTEVEGLAPGAAAEHLGTTANNTAQLAHRARTRLRERYLTAHVDRTQLRPECQFATERLAAYAGGGLGKRDTAKVADHLEDCDECTERLALVEELTSTLRRAIIPLPLALVGSAGAAKVIASAGVGGAAGAGAAAGSAVSVGGRVLSMPKWAHRAVAAGAAATLAGSVVALSTGVGEDDPGVPREVALERPSASTSPPSATQPDPAEDDEQSQDVARFGPGFGRSSLPPPVLGPATSAENEPPPPDNGDGSSSTPPPPRGGQDGEPSEEPPAGGVVDANVGGTFGGESGGVTLGAGGGETGVQLGPVVVGDEPEVPEGDGLLVEVGGELVPPTRIELP